MAAPLQPAWRRWLLVRRRVGEPTALTAYVVCAPEATALATVVQVAGNRWTVERCFEEAKGEVGLDQYAVRNWTGWYRPVTLAMWAYALLTVLRADPPAHSPIVKKNLPGLCAGQSDRLQDLARVEVPLRVREIRRLFWGLALATQQRVERMLAWSVWRRWHQGITQYWHYKRRSVP